MSLFIDALAKRIFYYMNYRDEEIEYLKEQNSKGDIVCGRYCGEIHIVCDVCLFGSCEDCIDHSEWVFMGLRDGGDIVLNPNDENEEMELWDYRMFCSHVCFKKYYGEDPVIGQMYQKIHLCEEKNNTFNFEFKEKSEGIPNGTRSEICKNCNDVTCAFYICDKCDYLLCELCYSTKSILTKIYKCI